MIWAGEERNRSPGCLRMAVTVGWIDSDVSPSETGRCGVTVSIDRMVCMYEGCRIHEGADELKSVAMLWVIDTRIHDSVPLLPVIAWLS